MLCVGGMRWQRWILHCLEYGSICTIGSENISKVKGESHEEKCVYWIFVGGILVVRGGGLWGREFCSHCVRAAEVRDDGGKNRQLQLRADHADHCRRDDGELDKS